ncbi:MAG TPA: nuclear transport factor 2 family protein [Spongiibacteraceae bacterium]|jgi:hypothetical protein|nr:nuclear transport factor 2 family protein [Spongiibacteraceae bacterium]
MPLTREQLESATQRLVDAQGEAERRNEWTFFVDSIYAPDSVYICEYAGTMLVKAEGREQIKATHYGRDMQNWEGWTFPSQGIYIGSDNRIINHWMNRGPGLRADGSYFETPGLSFIRFNDAMQIEHQLDMFDLAHQMVLCDQLEAAGLLSAALKSSWVVPMKNKLKAALSV